MIIFDLSFLFELRSIVLSFLTLSASLTCHNCFYPYFTFLLYSDKINSWILIKSTYLSELFGQNYTSHKLKITYSLS